MSFLLPEPERGVPATKAEVGPNGETYALNGRRTYPSDPIYPNAPPGWPEVSLYVCVFVMHVYQPYERVLGYVWSVLNILGTVRDACLLKSVSLFVDEVSMRWGMRM
jgi:hypothetical protein